MRPIKKILLVALVSFIFVEIGIRIIPFSFMPISWAYKIKEKQVHCYDLHTRAIRLCSNVETNLCHPLGYCFTLTTNQNSERITPEAIGEKIWILGDSLSMGFGNDDQDSFPFLLGAMDYQIRNLASDSLGATHSFRILEYELKNITKDKKPIAIVWIFSRSDFQDDLQNEYISYKFYLGKIFQFLNVLRAELEEHKLERDRNDYKEYLAEDYIAPENSHPTLGAILSIADLSISKGIVPIAIMAPDWNYSTRKPDLNTEYFKFMEEFFIKANYTVINLTDIYKNSTEDLYIPRDGHPNANAQKIFASETEKLLKLKINKRL